METEHPDTIGNYEVVGVIGKGAMGKVYKAVEPKRNTVVAIKVLPPELMKDNEFVERFEREAEAASLLNHPNVVRMIERGQEGDLLYFVMEFVPGTSLEAILRERRLSLPEAIRIFKSVCSGIEAAHRKSVVHRDLSPKNVLVSEDLSVVKVADFGISRVEAISQQQGTLSTTEFSLGSLHYIAPEQARNMVSADHRADIYSLGVLLYEMLTGRVPVGTFSLPSQLNSEAPSEIDTVVLRCLEIDPERRYQTLTRLLRDIKQLEHQLRLGLVHEVRGIGSQTTKILRRSTAGRWVRIALIAIGAVSLAVTAVLAFRSLTDRPNPATQAAETASNDLEPPVGEAASPDPDPATAEASDPDAETLEGAAVAASDGSAGSTGAGTSEFPSAGAGQSPEGLGGTDQTVPLEPQEATPAAPTAPAQADLRQDLEVARDKFEAGLPEEALADMEQFLIDHANTTVTPEAYLLVGRIQESLGDSAKARAAYVELQSRFPGSDAAIESTYRDAKLLASDAGRESQLEARLLLAGVADDHPRSRWAAAALIEKARIELEAKVSLRDQELDDTVPAALVTYRDLVARYPDHPGCEGALWNLGEMYAELRKFELAATAYETLGARFPKTRLDVWWSLGQIYDRRLDDENKAVVAYRKVPLDSRRHDDAQRRIAKLTR